MPIVAIFLGAIMVDLGFRGTEHQFATQLGKDLSGGHFWAWLASITIIGSLGYYSPAKKISDTLLLLVIMGLALSQKGIYQNFAALFVNPPAPSPSVPLPQFGTASDAAGLATGVNTASSALTSVMDFLPLLGAL
jgi:hypothetical protein